ncbi:MAG: nucleotide sugar dehydrogenase [Acidobacteriota bacterium]
MSEKLGPTAQHFLAKVEDRSLVAGVIGLGYVGLPLAVETARSGFRTLGFDVDPQVVEGVSQGRSHILDVSSAQLAGFVESGRLEATADMPRLAECDALMICVPTPLSKVKDPDLSYVLQAAGQIRQSLRPGQLVVLESTTYPGTTREVVLDRLQGSSLKAGQDFFLCYSPERVDPGNSVWKTRNTPKVMGGLTEACLKVGQALYAKIFETIVPVTSPEAAELTKVYENTFRMINIALVNELAQACDKLGVDVWEVIEAAATKPFGFMKFTPGPGLGGHCIPLDPHFLSWKMRTLAFKTRLIELASEINAEMPAFVVGKISEALNDQGKPVRGSRILIVGVSYKRDIDDLRESPAMEIVRRLEQMGGQVEYHDPYCPVLEIEGPDHLPERRLESVSLTPERVQAAQAVVIVTDHSNLDYRLILDHAQVVIDTRGVTRFLKGRARVVSLSGAAQRPGSPEAATAG